MNLLITLIDTAYADTIDLATGTVSMDTGPIMVLTGIVLTALALIWPVKKALSLFRK